MILRWAARSCLILPYLSIAMVPGFLLTDGSNMKDGNNSFSPMLQDSLVSFFFFLWRFDPIPGNGLPWKGFTISPIGHVTLGRTPLEEWSARRRDIYLTKYNTHNRQSSRPSTGFEPAIPAKNVKIWVAPYKCWHFQRCRNKTSMISDYALSVKLTESQKRRYFIVGFKSRTEYYGSFESRIIEYLRKIF